VIFDFNIFGLTLRGKLVCDFHRIILQKEDWIDGIFQRQQRAGAIEWRGFSRCGTYVVTASRIVNSFSFVQLKFSGLVIDRLPDGQIKSASGKIKVQPLPGKYSGFPKWQIIAIIHASRSTGGAARDRHGRGAGCGGRGWRF
jgi:hypothetical protein